MKHHRNFGQNILTLVGLEMLEILFMVVKRLSKCSIIEVTAMAITSTTMKAQYNL